MVLGQIIITAAKYGIKYRKQIYKVLTAQDKYIGQAWRRGGYGRQAQYGVRSGALAGSVIGTIISNYADDSPGNGIQKTFVKRPKTGTPYKARSGPSVRSSGRSYSRTSTYQSRRCPSPRKYYRS